MQSPQSKAEWDVLVESTAQSHTKLATSIQFAIERQWQQQFSEIRNVCDANYQDFVDAIEEIVRMKLDLASVQQGIAQYHRHIQDATSPVLSAYQSYKSCIHYQKQIDEALTQLSQCQRIVVLAARVNEYIEMDKLFHAYQMLAKLRSETLTLRGQVFPQQMNAWADRSVLVIKETAKRNVSKWLESVRASSKIVGEYAVRRHEEQSLEMQSHVAYAESDASYELVSLKALTSDVNEAFKQDEIQSGYLNLIQQHLSPMLRVIHVLRTMDHLPELVAFYSSNRLPQLQLQSFLTGDVAMIKPEKLISQYQELLKKLTGAFCLEHFLWKLSSGDLLSKKEINGVFILVVQSLSGVMTASVLRIEDSKTILEIKRSAILCARTLGDKLHGYDTSSIFQSFRKAGAHFRHCALADVKRKLQQILSEDTFSPLKVKKADLAEVIDVCGLRGGEFVVSKTMESKSDVILLPFTEIVRQSCKTIDALVQMMFCYEKYLNVVGWGDAVRDDTIEAFGFLNEILNNWIDASTDLQVSMVVTMGINASYLATACDRFESIIKQQIHEWEARLQGMHSSFSTCTKTNENNPVSKYTMGSIGAKRKFENTMTRAQDMVCELMIKKIDELLSSFYFVDWTVDEPSMHPDPATWDLINYLRVTFDQLRELPTIGREAVHFASCIHIAKSFEQLLYGPNIKKVSIAAILNFKRNLDAILEFIESLKILHLRQSFTSISMLVELLCSGNVEKFLDPQQREGASYGNLSAENVHVVYAKMKSSKAKYWGGSKNLSVGTAKKSILGSVVRSLRLYCAKYVR